MSDMRVNCGRPMGLTAQPDGAIPLERGVRPQLHRYVHWMAPLHRNGEAGVGERLQRIRPSAGFNGSDRDYAEACPKKL